MAVRHIDDFCRAKDEISRPGNLLDFRRRPDEDRNDQTFFTGFQSSGQRRNLTGVSYRSRDSWQAGATLQQGFVFSGSRIHVASAAVASGARSAGPVSFSTSVNRTASATPYGRD